tara:strand:- start:1006 stop:1164 length:159 start_codon:yes stop_codon:yes gene_type:complete
MKHPKKVQWEKLRNIIPPSHAFTALPRQFGQLGEWRYLKLVMIIPKIIFFSN